MNFKVVKIQFRKKSCGLANTSSWSAIKFQLELLKKLRTRFLFCLRLLFVIWSFSHLSKKWVGELKKPAVKNLVVMCFIIPKHWLACPTCSHMPFPTVVFSGFDRLSNRDALQRLPRSITFDGADFYFNGCAGDDKISISKTKQRTL